LIATFLLIKEKKDLLTTIYRIFEKLQGVYHTIHKNISKVLQSIEVIEFFMACRSVQCEANNVTFNFRQILYEIDDSIEDAFF